MLYIVNKNNFNGYMVARMSNDRYVDGEALRFDEYKQKKGIPGLITVTKDQFKQMREEYRQSLQTDFKKIEETEYYNLINKLKIKRHSLSKNFALFYLKDEQSAFGIHTLCVQHESSYYYARKDIHLNQKQIKSFIENRKHIFVFDLETASHCVDLFNYMEDNNITDILQLFDSNPDKIRLNNCDLPFAHVEDKHNRYIIYLDIEFIVDRKELEKLLHRFFCDNYLSCFEKKFSRWSEYREKSIAFRDGKGLTYEIWQYRF